MVPSELPHGWMLIMVRAMDTQVPANQDIAAGSLPAPSAVDAAAMVADARLAALLARMAQGDEAALGDFYDVTLGKVYGLALRITGKPELAEDVAAEVYHQGWRQAGQYDGARGRPLAWLLSIARSRALDTLRRQDEAIAHPEPESLVEAPEADGADPQDLLLGLERDSTLHVALETLAPVQRQLLALAFYRDMSHQEIADHLAMPLGTVKSHIRKALLKLQALLAHSEEARP